MDLEDVPLDLAGSFETRTLEDWHARVEGILRGGSFEERLVTHTADGIRYAPLYTRLDGPLSPQPVAAGPGGWDIRPLVVAATPDEAREIVREEIAGGATSLTLQLAASAQMGLSPSDIAKALAGLATHGVTIALRPGDAFTEGAADLMAHVQSHVQSHVQAPSSTGRAVRGAINADPLGAASMSGGLRSTLAHSLEDMVRLFGDARPYPGLTVALADGRPYHDAGAGSALEIATAIATLIAYLRAFETGGIPPGEAMTRIPLSLAAHADQLVVIAKLRAARRVLWLVYDAMGIERLAPSVPVWVTTSWRMLTRDAPETNILRNTIAAAAAAMGGADAITVLPHTWPSGPPDASARRTACNIQHILMREAFLARVRDPGAGAWAIEHLTNDIAHKAWSVLQDIEKQGGMAAALTSGYVQERVAASAERRRKLVATGQRAITGASAYVVGPNRTSKALGKATGKATGWPALPTPSFVYCVAPLDFERDAEPFERLRQRACLHAGHAKAEAGVAPPPVFLATLGRPADFSAHLAWVRNVLAAGGLPSVGGEQAFTASGPVGLAFSESGARLAIVISSDDVYEEIGEATVMALRSAGAAWVGVVGRPNAHRANALRAAGADTFLHAGGDLVVVLCAMLDKAGA